MGIGFDDSLRWSLLFTLYAHALLRGSHIFPDVELCDESPDYDPFGFTDIWKVNHHGDQVCIKVIRMGDTHRLGIIKRVRGSFFNRS